MPSLTALLPSESRADKGEGEGTCNPPCKRLLGKPCEIHRPHTTAQTALGSDPRSRAPGVAPVLHPAPRPAVPLVA